MQAIVIKSTGSWYTVKTVKNQIFSCRLKGKFRKENIKSTSPVVVGDIVSIQKQGQSWLITEIKERKNFIVRKSVKLSKQEHIIASNIDQAILMVTIENPITTTEFIDRFLAAAQSHSVPVVIIFNKLDIYNSTSLKEQQELYKVYTRIGYTCIAMSVLHDSLLKVKSVMVNKVNLIAGHSGVGKSTLINNLQPGLDLPTKVISESHKQGQHTTTFSELYDLDFGASVIDTPGIRGFGLFDIMQGELGDYFCDFFTFKKDCKFNNCIHVNEPNCAIKDAVEEGRIYRSRYINYLSMLEEEKTYRR